MITHDTVSEVQRFGIAGETQMTMKMGRKGFRILINNLYSDKPAAIVREISYNAWDAHRMANNPDPIEITIPNYMDHNFVVKDNGIGLSPEDVRKYLGTLFESSKEHSNDQVGTWGLGAKSPFSLTESFSVESRWNGTLYKFMFFLNEEGIPSVLATGEEPTTERNGITYSLPVGANMYKEFVKAVRNQLFMMDPKPIIVNEDNFTWIESEVSRVVLNTSIIKLKENSHAYTHGQHSVSMGGVIYPLDMNKLDNTTTDFLRSFSGDSRTITSFGIGVLDIQPSREGLSYDEPTVTAINQYFANFKTTFFAESLAEVKPTDLPVSAWRYLMEVRSQNSAWNSHKATVMVNNYPSQVALGYDATLDVYPQGRVGNDAGRDVYFTAKKDFIHEYKAVEKVSKQVLDPNSGKTETQWVDATVDKKVRYRPYRVTVLRGSYWNNQKLDWKASTKEWDHIDYQTLQNNFAVDDQGIFFIIDDVEKNFRRRANQCSHELGQRCSSLYQLSITHHNDPAISGVTSALDLMKVMDGTEFEAKWRKRFIMASSIVLPKAEKRVRTTVKGLLRWGIGRTTASPIVADETEINAEFFVRTDGSVWHFLDDKSDVSSMSKLEMYNITQFTNTGILQFQKGGWRKEESLREDYDVVSFQEWFDKFVADFNPSAKFRQGVVNHFNASTVNQYRHWLGIKQFRELAHPFIKVVEQCKNASSDAESLQKALENMGLTSSLFTLQENMYIYLVGGHAGGDWFPPFLKRIAEDMEFHKSAIADVAVAKQQKEDFAAIYPMLTHAVDINREYFYPANVVVDYIETKTRMQQLAYLEGQHGSKDYTD